MAYQLSGVGIRFYIIQASVLLKDEIISFKFISHSHYYAFLKLVEYQKSDFRSEFQEVTFLLESMARLVKFSIDQNIE